MDSADRPGRAQAQGPTLEPLQGIQVQEVLSHTTLGEIRIRRIKSNPYLCRLHSRSPCPGPAPPHHSRGWQAFSANSPIVYILGFAGHAGLTTITLLNSATVLRKQPQTTYKQRGMPMLPQNFIYKIRHQTDE